MTLTIIKILNVLLATWSGFMLVAMADVTNAFLGNTYPTLGLIAGTSSLIYAAHLLSFIVRTNTYRWELGSFIFGDILWVTGTLIAVTNPALIGTDEGQTIALLVAAGVAVAGLSYAYQLRQTKSQTV